MSVARICQEQEKNETKKDKRNIQKILMYYGNVATYRHHRCEKNIALVRLLGKFVQSHYD